MVLGIDASRANKREKTGVEWYSYYVIEHLKNVVPPDVTVRLYSREPLGGELAALPARWESHVLGWPPRYLWTLVRLSWEMLRRPPDLLFVPAHVLPLVLPARTVTTIHDIGFDRYPAVYPWWQVRYHRWNVRRSLRRCLAVLTVSAWTKGELAAVYGERGARVYVTPLAYDARRFRRGVPAAPQQALAARYDVKPPYFAFVGRREGKKNVVRLVAAFAQFLEHTSPSPAASRAGWQLVLVGPPGNAAAAVDAAVERLRLQDSVRVLDWAPADDLAALLAGATALVFPTLYEGFGLPILEAMAVGTPVVTSDRGANREVAGGAARLVNPEDVDAIAATLGELARDVALGERLRVVGLERAAEFSWERTAEETWRALATLRGK